MCVYDSSVWTIDVTEADDSHLDAEVEVILEDSAIYTHTHTHTHTPMWDRTLQQEVMSFSES